MKNRYEIQLDNWIKEFNLEYEEKYDSREIQNIIIELFKSKCYGKRIALWGAGRKNTTNSHAAVILKKFTTYLQGMCCIIDSLPELWGDEFMGYPIISPNDIVKSNVDIVIISSKVQADSIIKDLKKYAPKCEYVDIYEELRIRGIVRYHNFYEDGNIYTTLFQLRKSYENSEKKDEKSKALRKLISAYLSISDLYYAKKYAKEYIDNEYANYDEIQAFIAKLDQMETEIKNINSKKKDDVVIFFVDSLRAIDVFHKNENGSYSPDMLKSYLKNATIFTNAKSTGVTTYESMISVIKQKYPYEQNVYKNNMLTEFNDFKLLESAKKQGYDIKFYISEGFQIINDNPNVDFIKQVYLSAKLWKLTTDMACEKNKSFNFIYVPFELHFPLICGYHREEPKTSDFVDVGVIDHKDFVPRQLEECKDYVDKLFEYYETWFSEDILFSLFSDHSQVIYDTQEQKPYFMYYNNQNRSVNVTFFIKGFGIEHHWNENLISLYDFYDIFRNLIENKTLVDINREIAVYQYYKIHYKKLREYAQTHNMKDYIDGIQCFTSKDYLYVITATGKEEFYILGDNKSDINEDNAIEFKKLIEEQYTITFPKFIVEE